MAHRELRSVIPGAGAPASSKPTTSTSPVNVSFYHSNYAIPANTAANTPYLGGFEKVGGYATFENEPPLLEELGIHPEAILRKTLVVLNPMKKIDPSFMDEADMSGPVFFCLLMGFFLLFTGKVHFGYIYGLSAVGCIGIYCILNLMSTRGTDLYRSCSVLGYGLLPMVILAFLSLTIPIRSSLGFVITAMALSWCTYTTTSMFVIALDMAEQRFLIAYPVALFYTCFALITVF